MLTALFVIASTFAAAGAPPATNAAENNLSGLVAAERGFAADAQTMGVRDAFVLHIAPDGLLFRPQPVRAKAWYDAHPAPPGAAASGSKLEWGPEYAEIASSGDFGFTYGPWRSTAKTDKGEQHAWGHFFSVWKRGDDGVWRNVVDHGYSHPEVPLESTLVMRSPGRRVAVKLGEAERTHREEALLKQDDALNGADGANAQKSYAAPAGVHFFRDGALPGELAAGAPAVAKGLKRIEFGMASSADLAFTLGARADGKADGEGGYVRMWRRDHDSWRLVADLLTPPN
jgi:ketosteroid isomerase-like protein